MSERIEQLLRRYADAKTMSMNFQNQFEDIYDYFMPNKNISKESAQGSRHNVHLYDTTGVIALRSFVAQLHTGLTPPGMQWLELSPGSNYDESKPDFSQTQEDLKKVTDLIFRFINNSNFDLAINESYYDLGVGTGAIVVNEGSADNPLIFSSVPLMTIYPEAGVNGQIETVWRYFSKFHIRNIDRTWPQAKISENLKMLLQQDPNATTNIIEGTVFNGTMDKPKWNYVVIEERTKEILVDQVITSSPWIIFRAYKRNDEVFGRGPADQALPSMKSLNAMMEDELKAARLKANPIFLGASDGIFNPYTINLEPWSIIAMSQTSIGNPPISPIPMGGDPKYSEAKVAEFRDMINKIFFTEPLGPLDPNSNLTATEVMLRNQMALEQKVPFIGRLQVEFLDKLTQRIVYILSKKGLIPDLRINGKEVSLKYKSPLIQTQGLQNVNRAVQLAQTAQQIFGPQLSVMGLNSEEWFQYLATNLDVDPKLVKSKTQLEELGEKASKAASQKAQLPNPPTGGIPQGQDMPAQQQPGGQ